MAFRPQINNQLIIGNESYTFTEHPSAKGMPYGQAGRRATVYQVRNRSSQLRALKVFTPAFRSPRTEDQADKLARYSILPGLIACKRVVISPSENPKLISNYPDLSYSVLMPWLQGTTWQEVVMNRQNMTKENSLSTAARFLSMLAIMESKGVAHCDLSGPNLIVNLNSSNKNLNGNNRITLIDLEDLYALDLQRPEKLPAGSAGYAHHSVKTGIWSAEADRFSGAVLIANILGWSNRTIRDIAYGEQYFDTAEMQESCARYKLLVNTLESEWGSPPADLFKRAWQSSSLESCPRFSEWTEALKIEIPKVELTDTRSTQVESSAVLTSGPVTGWRSISGENQARLDQPVSSNSNQSKTYIDAYAEFVEWDQLQKQRKTGHGNQGTSTKHEQIHNSTNKNNPEPSNFPDEEHIGSLIAFWVFAIAVFIGMLILISN